VEAIVTESIVDEKTTEAPPANTPFVFEEHAPKLCLAAVRSPKSIALPVDAMVM
jgi:hypothetical protein